MEGAEPVKEEQKIQEDVIKKPGNRDPVVCLLGTTGCGKSTFCHLI